MTFIGTTNEDAIRRLRAVGKVLRSTDCKCGLQSNQTMLETIEGTLAALDAAATQIEMMRKHHVEGLETDSLIASCGCMTKTNEVRFHKPGCKYRLICERNDARKTPREGGTTNCVKCGVEIPQSALCAECWSKSAFPKSGENHAPMLATLEKIAHIPLPGIAAGEWSDFVNAILAIAKSSEIERERALAAARQLRVHGVDDDHVARVILFHMTGQGDQPKENNWKTAKIGGWHLCNHGHGFVKNGEKCIKCSAPSGAERKEGE